MNHEERVGRTRVTGAAGEDGGGRQTSSRKHLSRHAVASEAVERIRIRTEKTLLEWSSEDLMPIFF